MIKQLKVFAYLIACAGSSMADLNHDPNHFEGSKIQSDPHHFAGSEIHSDPLNF